MKIAENLYFYKGRGEDKLIRGAGSCNVIVAKCQQQVMIDTGLIIGGSFHDLERNAVADGVDLSKTRAVLHTHSHWDHITGDCIVQREYGAKVYAHPWEKPVVESQEAGFRAMLLDTGEFYKEIFGLPPIFYKILLRYLGGSYRDLHVDVELRGGEKLDFGAPVEVVYTPGHSPGHLGYYFPETKAFAGGDLIDLETGDCVDLNNPYSDYGDGLASLENMRAMDIELYLPSHGDPVSGKENVKNVLDKMISNTRSLLNQILDFLSSSSDGFTLTDTFNNLFPNTPFTLKAMKMMLALACLKRLEKEGKASFIQRNNKILWRSQVKSSLAKA